MFRYVCLISWSFLHSDIWHTYVLYLILSTFIWTCFTCTCDICTFFMLVCFNQLLSWSIVILWVHLLSTSWSFKLKGFMHLYSITLENQLKPKYVVISKFFVCLLKVYNRSQLRSPINSVLKIYTSHYIT